MTVFKYKNYSVLCSNNEDKMQLFKYMALDIIIVTHGCLYYHKVRCFVDILNNFATVWSALKSDIDHTRANNFFWQIVL